MTGQEQSYKDLVGEDGYQKALVSYNQLTNYNKQDIFKQLFFVTLLNAYWRGAAATSERLLQFQNELLQKGDDGKPTH